MATLKSPAPPATEIRLVVRCRHCQLNQFMTRSSNCRRCRRSLLPEPPPKPAGPSPDPEPPGIPSIGERIRELRTLRGLFQAQLAYRMGVPRTYISKIENGKAMPTLSSLERLARALSVNVSDLLSERSVAGQDPFLVELIQFLPDLLDDDLNKLLAAARSLAERHRSLTA